MAVLIELAEFASMTGIVFKDGFAVNALSEFSLRLCRCYYVLYNRSLYALARVSGNDFRAGIHIDPILIKAVLFPFRLTVSQPPVVLLFCISL